jgi:hypothetical protein
MSNDDELERLLREVDASLSGATSGAVAPKRGEVATTPPASSTQRSRPGIALRTGAVAGGVCGVGVFVGATLLSWLPGDQAAFQSGIGAFVGAFVTGAVLSMRGGR